MIIKVLFGVLLGFALVRFSFWRRQFRGHGRFRRGPFRMLHAIRALGLDSRQRAHVKEMMVELRRLGTELRFARFDAMEDLSAALGGDTFDRARLEALAARQKESFARAESAVLTNLEALHASLSTEQRARLRDLLNRRGAEQNGAEPHPYR